MIGTIVNQSDIYMYFESIEQIEAKSILDIGMFLKRIGAVSRQAMDEEIDETVQLDGVDFMPEENLKVYQSIYNKQMTLEMFMQKVKAGEKAFGEEKYDLVMMFRPEQYLTMAGDVSVWKWLEKHAKYVITNCETEAEWQELQKKGRCRAISVDDESYGLISF